MRISDWSSDVCSSDLIHSLSRSLATAEDIDHIDGNADLIQTGPDEFTVHMLPSDLRIDRYHAMALFLKKSHDAIARPRRIVRDADHGDSVRFRSEEHTSELQSLMRNSYAVFCLKKKYTKTNATPCFTTHDSRSSTAITISPH